MKDQKTRNKIIAAVLAFLMVFVNIPITSVYSDDSIKDMRTYTDIMDYIEATSDLIAQYPCDLNDVINIDVENDIITDAEGELYFAYDSTVSSVLAEDVKKAEELLFANGYQILDVSNNTISVEDPYQTKRIIIEADNLTTGNGAEKIIHYGNEYILQFNTVQDTIYAYSQFINDSTLDNVFLDVVVSLDTEDKSIDDFYVVDPSELVNGQKDHYSWGVTAMGLDVMQDNLQSADYTLEDVVVAVLDTGVNYNNKYLENRILATGYNFVDNDMEVMDNFGHGTHVAGIICDGTASNTKILPIKVLNDSGKGSLLYVKNGIMYSVSNGASVINLSLSAEDESQTVTYLENTFQYAIDNNVVIVGSAGNDATDVANYYPSRSPLMITVGALDTTMALAYYSNVGEEVDFCVPGSSIISAYKTGLAYKSGTSMSSPHVAAAVALLKTWNKDLTVSEVKDLLIEYSVDLGATGKDNNYGYGNINLANFDVSRTCKHEYVSNLTKEATCEEKGLMTYTCKHCNESYTEEVKALGHDYTQKITEATCLLDGYTTYTCKNCNEKFTTDIKKATGHSYISEVIQIATCEKDGILTYTCEKCNDSYEELIQRTGHNYQSEVTKEPTHFEDGVRIYTCSNCQNSYDEAIPKAEHNFTISTVPARCLDQGYDLHVCHECGYSYQDNFTAALGHDHQLTSQKNPTCEEAGYYHYNCSRCNDALNTPIPALGHNYTKQVIKPTCIKQGYSIYTCQNENCGVAYESDYVSALGHNYVNTVTKATCIENGFTLHKCSECDDEYTDSIVQATGHRYTVVTTPAKCDVDGSVNYHCDFCGHSYSETIKAQGHSYYKTTISPSCEETGRIDHICNVCGYTYTETTLEALGHDYTDTIIPPTCTDKGYTLHACVRCEKSYSDTYVEKLSHQYTITGKKDATCLLTGSITYKCNDCEDTYDTIIPALGHSIKVSIVEPKCGVKGYTLSKCEVCGEETKTNYVDGLEHAYTSKVTKEASCGFEGELTYTCQYCDDSYTETIPALEHSYKTTVVNPTCTKKGYTLHVCENCKDEYKDNFLDVISHNYEGKITKQPTHNIEGEMTYTCKDCGDFYTSPIEKTEHNIISKVIAPTCLQKGYTLYECADDDCNYSYKDNYVDALGHEYEGEVTKEAKCAIEGEITYTCKHCNDTYTETIEALTHNYISTIINPTCSKEGYTNHKCSICGSEYNDTKVEKLPHVYHVEKQTDVTCTEKGTILYRCDNCDDFYTVELDIIPHNYAHEIVAPTCITEGYTKHTCSICNESYNDTFTNIVAHTKTDWIVDKTATCEENGSQHKECTVCGQTTDTETLPAIGHKYTVTKIEPTTARRGYTQHECENCGHIYKDNYVDCKSEVINTIYKAFSALTSFFSKWFR